MDVLKIFKQVVMLCALLTLSLHCAAADDIQDANKLFKLGQNAQALVKVNGFLASKPKDAQARFLKGLIINEQGQTDEAIKIFSELTDEFPELPEPYNNLAVLYAGKGLYDKARSSLEMAIRTHPNYATAHENLGDIYAKMASQSYERALQLDKNSTSSQTKLTLIRELFTKGQRGAKAADPAPAIATPAAAASAPQGSAPAVGKPLAAVVNLR
jgi:tetratricopeptide (TPR) repeat protein